MGNVGMNTKTGFVKISVMLFALALAARLFYLHAGKEYYQEKVLASDGKKYETIARSILAPQWRNIWPRIPPGYPVFLAGVMRISGANYVLAVQAIQILLSSLVAVLIYAFSLRIWHAPPLAALGAAGLWALFPPALHASLMVGREELLAFLLAGAVLAWCHALLSGATGMALLSGVLLALAGIIKPVPVYLAPVLIASLLMAPPCARRRRLARAVCCLAPVAAGIFLVSWYNHSQWQQWYYARSGYYEMYCGSKPEYMVAGELRYQRVRQNLFEMNLIRATQLPEAEWEQVVIQDEVFKALFAGEIKKRLLDEPLAAAGFFFSKISRLLYMTDTGTRQFFLLLLNLPLLILACAGAAAGWRSPRPGIKAMTFALASAVLVWALLHSLVIPLNRYFYVITPLLLVLAANIRFSGKMILPERTARFVNRALFWRGRSGRRPELQKEVIHLN